MALTGLPFLVALIAVAAAFIGGTMLLWNRWRWPWAVPARLLCLLLIMAVGAALAGDIVNRNFGFYSSFNDLLGREPLQGTVVSTAGPSAPDAGGGGHSGQVWPTNDVGGKQVGARVIQVRLDGARSGIRRDALVYLPAAYFVPSQSRRRFPVIELIHGYPGNPTNWTRQMHFAQTLNAEIAAGTMPPVIAVIPLANDPGHDSECVDALGGQKDETYLAVDVPEDIQREFRTLATRDAWATFGYSTGGFCAVNIALHHPGLYGAAASLSGYYIASVNASTLYRGQLALRRWNSPQWLVAHAPATASLYLVASRGDPPAMWAMLSMRHATHNRWPLVTVTLPGGGHNFSVWYAASLAAFRWLGAHLALR